MGRPRKPTPVLELTGAFKKDPQRRRDAEPVCEGPLGDPPLTWDNDEELRSIWKEIVSITPAGVLTRADRLIVEMICITMKRVRSGHALLGEMRLLMTGLGKLGLTPADRSKVSIAKEEDEDEFAKLAAEL